MNIRMSQGNIQNLAQLRQIMNAGLKLNYILQTEHQDEIDFSKIVIGYEI